MDSKHLPDLAARFATLYMRLYRLLDRRLAEQGATLARAKLLFYLDRHGSGRAADIAAHFNQAPRTVTEAIDGLERHGMVTRENDPHDRRVKRIELTRVGKDALAVVEPLRMHLIDQIFGALTQAERTQFDALLIKLEEAVATQEIDERTER